MAGCEHTISNVVRHTGANLKTQNRAVTPSWSTTGKRVKTADRSKLGSKDLGSKDRHGNVAFIQNLKVSFSMAKLHCFNSVWLVLSPGCIGVGHSHQEHKGQGGNPLPAALAAVNWAGNKPATATISRAVGSVFLQPDSCLGSARCSCWRTAHVPGPHLCCLINNRIHTCTRR